VPGKWTVALSGVRRVSGAENHPDKAWSDELAAAGSRDAVSMQSAEELMSVGMIEEPPTRH
jgi:hypothetical protein